MKITHRVPVRELRSDPITPEYQDEVDRATRSLQVRYEAAQRRLNRAEEKVTVARRRAEAAQSKHRLRDEVNARIALRVAQELAELRREELEAIERLMKSSPASAPHRGVASFRPLPDGRGSLL